MSRFGQEADVAFERTEGRPFTEAVCKRDCVIVDDDRFFLARRNGIREQAQAVRR